MYNYIQIYRNLNGRFIDVENKTTIGFEIYMHDFRNSIEKPCLIIIYVASNDYVKSNQSRLFSNKLTMKWFMNWPNGRKMLVIMWKRLKQN